jgi:hypothetical protein
MGGAFREMIFSASPIKINWSQAHKTAPFGRIFFASLWHHKLAQELQPRLGQR